MSIQTNLHGRLRNTSLPASNCLLPVFEAVSNAIHAIEDAGVPSSQGRITVRIDRTTQSSLGFDHPAKRPGPDAKGDIVGFTILDNGIGLNDANMESFRTLDSEYKAARGGRGVGRLLWLKAFDRAEVESVFMNGANETQKRVFSFDARQGVSEPIVVDVPTEQRGTQIRLRGFSKRFQQSAPKTAKAIARALFEHCLWYFVRPGGAPCILIEDDDEALDLNDVYDEHMVAAATTESVDVKGAAFDLIHIKLSALSARGHNIAFCAANRLVTQESLKGRIPGLFGTLRDADTAFVYECYVSSPLLDERVRSERTSFDIEEEPLEMFATGEVSQRDIREAVVERATAFLSDYLKEKHRLSKERVDSFVSHKAPRYRPILARIPEEQLVVDPDITDRDLDLLLHKQLAEIESQLRSDGHDIMHPQPEESFPDYRARLDTYLQTVADIKRSDLANYVSHRRVIVDLLDAAVRKQPDGTYAREDLIHTLIMPMRTDSNDSHFETCNLWLVDERLAFHDYMASDKPLGAIPITGATDCTEPDIVALNIFDNPMLVADGSNLPPAALIVVELKRPMRNDAAQGEGKDPIEQALGYLDRIRQGKVQTSHGRLIPGSEHIPGFCYVLCDLTPTVVQRCKLHDAIRTSDGLGYFFYNKNYGAYVEIISFDRLVNMAKERNKAFFDKLGLPTT
ncbi:MAG: sensor histidine kinase [Phycisphaeraceae bacterium]|nr:sensor histidine kinase [Phycisphaeraceae bacterium]MBX3366221.1 sensor histidine kinase [Phycisphaeraceae bacterium]